MGTAVAIVLLAVVAYNFVPAFKGKVDSLLGIKDDSNK